jgi:GT2 family glycosyltransferase
MSHTPLNPSPSTTHPDVDVHTALQRLTVLLVTFQSAHCAASLADQLRLFPHVTVIDNDSADHSADVFQKALPHAHIIRNPRNLGFGAANNRGVAQATTEFVLLLNPDCIISADDAARMVSAADRYSSASAIGPQLIGRQGEKDGSYSLGPKAWPGKGPLAEAFLCVRFISGACMLIRRAAMEKIGGFDEDFFLYYEDTDLCLRLSAEYGEIIVHPDAQVTHIGRGSSGGKARWLAEYNRGYHHIQSKFLFAEKHMSRPFSRLSKVRYGLVALIECLLRLLVVDTSRAVRVWGRFRGTLAYQHRALPRNASQREVQS